MFKIKHLRLLLALSIFVSVFSFSTKVSASQLNPTFSSDGTITQNVIFNCTTDSGTMRMFYISDSDSNYHFMNDNGGLSCPSGHQAFFGNGQKFSDYVNYDPVVGWYYVMVRLNADAVCTNNTVCIPDFTGDYFRLHRDANDVWSDTDGPIPSSEKAITSFSFQGLTPAVNGVIDEPTHTVTLNVPFGTNVTALVPTITISTGASVSPDNNVAQNFTTPVVYTVTAADTSTQIYTVTVVAPCTINCFSNILFLPGLMGSKLYEQEGITDKKLWVSSDDSTQAELALDSQGKSINSAIYTKNDTQNNGELDETGIVDDIAGFNTYQSFISDLKKWKDDDHIIEDYAFIPYDWRLSLDDIITNGSASPDGNLSYNTTQNFSESFILQKLEALQNNSRTGKVTIIAHSNGGLVAKAFIKKLQDTSNPLYDKIDKIIFVAVPQVGTPDAAVALLHGTELGFWGFIMGNKRSRQLAENMSSIYNFLPSSGYFTTVDPAFAVDKVVSFEDQPFFAPQTSQYGVFVSNETELKNYILGTDGRTKPSFADILHPNIGNSSLYAQAESVHSILDSWQPSPDTKVIQVAGWGEETIAGLDYKTEKDATEHISYKPRMVVDGDGTVVIPSALWMSTAPNVERWWVDLDKYNGFFSPNFSRKHRDILEIPNLRSFINYEIKDSTFIDADNILVNNSPTADSTAPRLHFILHSPLTLGITDSEGRYTGMDPVTKEIKEEIPGVIYKQIGELQFLSIPTGIAYVVKLQGYADGNFSLDVDKQTGNEITESISFQGISSSTLTLATINIIPSSLVSTSELKIDQDGNGSIDKIYHIVGGEIKIETTGVSASGSLNSEKNSTIPAETSEQSKIETKENKNNKEVSDSMAIVASPILVNPTTSSKPIISIQKKNIVKKVVILASKKSSNIAIKNKPEIKANSNILSVPVVKTSTNAILWSIIKRLIYNIFH